MHHPLIHLLMLIILAVLIRATYHSFRKRTLSEEEHTRYQDEYEYLLEKKRSLEANIERLKTERGREEEYRERFNVVREGESVIRIIEEA